jgi:hypothetical protein
VPPPFCVNALVKRSSVLKTRFHSARLSCSVPGFRLTARLLQR